MTALASSVPCLDEAFGALRKLDVDTEYIGTELVALGQKIAELQAEVTKNDHSLHALLIIVRSSPNIASNLVTQRFLHSLLLFTYPLPLLP